MRFPAPATCLLVAGGLCLGTGAVLEDAGVRKPGRVLVDDSHSMEWEPSAHRLDESYFGDFSTYSFSSAVEHLGRRYAVDVHAGEEGIDRVLRGYDVLVLKTPVTDYSPAEIRAIHDWVADGGGLVAIGDHTDLMGMNRRLNEVVDRFGLHLECDAVRSLSNPWFVTWEAPLLGRPVPLAGVESVGFMTGCSVTCTGAARAAIVGRGVACDPGDYAMSSHFPRWANDPSCPAGAVPLLGVADFGDGRVAVCTDSTPLSSFDFYKGGNDAFLVALVEWAGRRRSGFAAVITALLAAGVLGVLWGAVLAGARALPSSVLLAAAAAAGGAAASDAANASAAAPPPERAPALRAEFLSGGCFAAYPPSLGGVGSLPEEANFDSLFVLAQRTGLECAVVPSLEEFEGGRADVLVAVNLRDRVDERDRGRLVERVDAGATVILLDREIPSDADSGAFRLLAAFGVSVDRICADHVHARGLREVPLAGAPFRAFCVDHGAGRVYWAVVGDRLTRRELGHCFAVPDAEQRRTYEAVFALLRDATGNPARPPLYGVLE